MFSSGKPWPPQKVFKEPASKPPVLQIHIHMVRNRDPIALEIPNQEFLNQAPVTGKLSGESSFVKLASSVTRGGSKH